MSVLTKQQRRARRRRRVRAKIRGTAQRPRLSVYRSNRGIFAQLIDDDAGRTVASVGWTEHELRGLDSMEQAKRAGTTLAERAKAAGVETCVFDRSGYRYHGRVQALADGRARGRAEAVKHSHSGRVLRCRVRRGRVTALRYFEEFHAHAS